MIQVKVNTPDFERQLNTIADDLKRKAVRSATGMAASIFRKAGVDQAPKARRAHRLAGGRLVKPGYLKANVYAYRARARAGEEHFKVSVRGGRTGRTLKSGAIRDAYYWRWVHEGRTTGRRIKGGKRRKALERQRRASAGKSVPGNPFLTRAFRASTIRALDAFGRRINEAVARYNALK